MRAVPAVLVTFALLGCYPSDAGPGEEPLYPQPRPPEDRSTQADKGPVMAYVNDRPVYMAALHDLLVRSHGLRLAQYLLVNEIVAQEARRKGLTVTPGEVRHQHNQTLRHLFPEDAGASQRERSLQTLLAQRDMSRKQWDTVMQRNALLARLAGEEIEVTDEELQREYGRRYGRQVVVRHIQTASLSDAQKVLKLLTDGGDFAKLAAKHSINPSGRNGGLLPPFGNDSPRIAPPLREAAMAMTRVGEISNPVMAGTSFHILKLEKIIDPEKKAFKDVRGALEASIRWQKAQFAQQRYLKDLIRRAKVRYADPILKQQANEAGSR